MDKKLLDNIITNKGENLYDLSFQSPVLLIFLRHFGCIFCREALKDVASNRQQWEAEGTKVVLVHMGTNEIAEPYFEKFDLQDLSSVSDPTTAIYGKFGLAKGSVGQLFGLQTVIRGFEVTMGKGIPVSMRQIGDGFQMPGIFLLKNGAVRKSYIHKNAADRPDYDDLIDCCR